MWQSQGAPGRASPGDSTTAFLDGLTERLGALGISGKGLEVAAQGSPLVGPIIRARPLNPPCLHFCFMCSNYNSHLCRSVSL